MRRTWTSWYAWGFLLWIAGLLLGRPGGAQNFDAVEIATVPVADGVFMLMGAGGNIGVSAGEDGVFLIDDQYAPLHPKIAAAIVELGAGPVRFVLNTHWHPDHTGGNELFGNAGALLVAHDNVRTRMSAAQLIEFFQRTSPPALVGALPVATFSDSLTFHFNGEEIHAVHAARAHTDGDAVVLFRRSNVVHTGDVYMAGRYPFIDLSTGGSVDGVIAAVDRVLGLVTAETKIIPGHGPLSTVAELRAYRDMLATIRDRVAAQVAAGATIEETLAAQPTAGFYEDAPGPVTADAFVKIVYADLAGNPRP